MERSRLSHLKIQRFGFVPTTWPEVHRRKTHENTMRGGGQTYVSARFSFYQILSDMFASHMPPQQLPSPRPCQTSKSFRIGARDGPGDAGCCREIQRVAEIFPVANNATYPDGSRRKNTWENMEETCGETYVYEHRFTVCSCVNVERTLRYVRESTCSGKFMWTRLLLKRNIVLQGSFTFWMPGSAWSSPFQHGKNMGMEARSPWHRSGGPMAFYATT